MTENEMVDGIEDSVDMSFSKFWQIVKDREAWYAALHEFKMSWTWFSDWTTTNDPTVLLLATYPEKIIFQKDKCTLETSLAGQRLRPCTYNARGLGSILGEGIKIPQSSGTTKKRRDTCTPVFIAILFIVAKTRSHPKWLSTDKWNNKMWYIFAMDYYSAITENEIVTFAATWVDVRLSH